MRPPLSLLFGAPGVMFFPADNRCAVGLEITLAYGDAVGLTRSEPVKVASVYSLCTSAYNENSKKSVMFPWGWKCGAPYIRAWTKDSYLKASPVHQCGLELFVQGC
jgi:hypothetical protein